MARIAVATTRQQRWLRAYRRITGSADNSGSLPDYSTGKRTRKFAATATATTATATVRANRYVLAATPTARTGTVTGASTGAPAVFRRYGSSKPGNPTETGSGTATAFPNPLHRNPSRISSSVGSIYKPPGYFLGIDNDPVLLPTDDEAVANSVRSCIKIDEHEHVHVHMHNNECTTGGIVIDGGKDDNDNDNDNWSDPHEKGLNTEMSLCFLGTGAGSPANIRSTSGAFLRLAGTTFMFDVGEGTQRQFQFAKGSSSISKIEKIFITHLHGDHIFGLPGFLLSLQTSLTQSDDSTRETANTRTKTQTNNKPRRRRRRQTVRDEDDLTVEIYGPPGLFNYIASAITLSCTRLHLLNVHVYELVGGRVRRVVTPPPNAGRHLPRGHQHQHQYRNGHDHRDRDRDPFHSDYPELRHNGGRLRRFEIPCRDGVWNIQYNPLPLSREEITAQMSMSMSMRRNTTTNRNKGLARQQLQQDRIKIRAAEVDHMPGVATFGFVVEEDEPPRNLDVARARALGVSHTDKKYELLKHGFAVTADDGSERRVEPHEVVRAATKKARKIAIVGDNRGWTRQMTEIAANADILVHEATLSEEDPTRGHSTAAMAGRNAAGCDAKLLILNHISPRMESNLSQVVREAYDASRQQLSVLMSFDFMEVVVPWMGFGTNGAEIKSGRTNSDTENLDLDKTNGKE